APGPRRSRGHSRQPAAPEEQEAVGGEEQHRDPQTDRRSRPREVTAAASRVAERAGRHTRREAASHRRGGDHRRRRRGRGWRGPPVGTGPTGPRAAGGRAGPAPGAGGAWGLRPWWTAVGPPRRGRPGGGAAAGG